MRVSFVFVPGLRLLGQSIPGNPVSMIQAGAAVSYQHVNLVAAPDWDVGLAER